MQKISTMQACGSENFQPGQLTVGLVLGDRWPFSCILDEAEQVLLEQKLRTAPEATKQIFAKIPPSRIAMETGTRKNAKKRAVVVVARKLAVLLLKVKERRRQIAFER